jgi:hypothetical protein
MKCRHFETKTRANVDVVHKDKKERIANQLAGRQVVKGGGIYILPKKETLFEKKKPISSTATK